MAENKTIAEFIETKKSFRNFFGNKTEFTYDEWNELPSDHKAAALYLNFYDTIMANLYRARLHKPVMGNASDLVSAATEKCIRIVPVLEAEPEKFTKGYVSLVMYNAFAITLSQLVSSKQKQFEVFNVGTFTEVFGENWDLSKVPGMAMDYSLEDEYFGGEVFKIISEQSKEMQATVERLFYGKKLTKRQEKLVPRIRKLLADYNC